MDPPSDHDLRDLALIRAYLTRVPGAERRLYSSRLIPVIRKLVHHYLVCIRRGDDRALEGDLVQDICIYVMLRNDAAVLRSWDPGRGRSLNSYLRLIAARRIAAYFAPKSQHEIDAIDPALLERIEQGPNFERIAEARDELDAVLARMTLSPRDRDLLGRLVLEGQEPSQVGKELGMSYDAVRQWHSRFRKEARRIRDELGRDDPLPPAPPPPEKETREPSDDGDENR